MRALLSPDEQDVFPRAVYERALGGLLALQSG